MTGVASLVFACAAACYAKAEIEQTCTEVGLCTGRPANVLLQAKAHIDANDSNTNQADWYNNWDGDLKYECPNDQWWYSMKSIYHTGHRDRRFVMECGKRKDANQGSRQWSNWVNNWDNPMHFSCATNEAISGMQSKHSNRREDRRWKFQCSRVKSPYIITPLAWSDWVNDWRQWASEGRGCSIQAGNAIKAVYSEHKNNQEDRRWQFQCGAIHHSNQNGQCVKCGEKHDQMCCIGDGVRTQWTTFEGGDGAWYNGNIQKTFSNGSITVNYNDGSTWTGNATAAEKLY